MASLQISGAAMYLLRPTLAQRGSFISGIKDGSGRYRAPNKAILSWGSE